MLFQRQQTETDCYRACIATLIDRTLLSVPDFYEDYEESAGWGDATEEFITTWLHNNGFWRVKVLIAGKTSNDVIASMKPVADLAPYILSGQTASGKPHAVICRSGEMIWNPATGDRTNPLVKPLEGEQWLVEFVMKPL